MAARSRVRGLLSCVIGLAGVGLLLLSAPPAESAWDGDHTIRLGDKVSAEFRTASPSETHRYAFYASKDTVLKTVLKVSRDARGLVPDLKLFTASDVMVDLGTAQRGNVVRNFKFANSGDYYFQVMATAGSGSYQLISKARAPSSAKGSTTNGSFSFDATDAAVMNARVKASKGSTATPTFTGLGNQNGALDLGPSAGTAKIKGLSLPSGGTYTLTIAPGTAGQSVDVRVKLKQPRPGRFWSVGYAEPPDDVPTQNRNKWLVSPHADHNAEAFNHWNNNGTPPTVQTACARCHSSTGFRDFIGDDGSAVGVVDVAPPVGQVIECDACHNDAASALTEVTFPSGLVISGLGKEARCMMCHQGRESTVSVEASIAKAAPVDDDTPTAGLKFLNVHYFAAGASLYGREAAGAYEYAEPGGAASDLYLTTLPQRKQYDRKFTHVGSKNTCIECHDPHSQKVRVEECATCHVNAAGNPVATEDDLHDIRMAGTVNDFNGNGNAAEGIWYEIKGLQDVLYAAMQDYATRVAGQGIVYDGSSYPYFFEAGTTNSFSKWTTRLVKAAYNYQYSVKDPGAFAHNGKFIVQFLYDSIDDLNEGLSALPTPSPVPNFANLKRNDPGHFDSAAEAYRHWDANLEVDASCARCHSIEGFEFVATYGIDQTIPAPLISGLSCESCHVEGTSFAPRAQNPNPDQKPERVYVASVQFPFPSTASSSEIDAVTIENGPKGSATQDDSFICMTCHRGRESKLTLDTADPTGATSTFTLSFKNVHYLSAGATMYGSKAGVMYQYPGNSYAQRWDHDQSYLQPYPAAADTKARCTFCHMDNGSHSFQPEVTSTCTFCHINSTSIDDLTPAFRLEDNYDNDAATKPKAEFEVFRARLLTAIQDYCETAKNNTVAGANYVAYDEHAYPYFVVDTNNDRIADPTEKGRPKFDTKSFRAVYNFNYAVKEPGAWAHNPKYVLQVLYDAIVDLGGDTTGLTRPN